MAMAAAEMLYSVGKRIQNILKTDEKIHTLSEEARASEKEGEKEAGSGNY